MSGRGTNSAHPKLIASYLHTRAPALSSPSLASLSRDHWANCCSLSRPAHATAVMSQRGTLRAAGFAKVSALHVPAVKQQLSGPSR